MEGGTPSPRRTLPDTARAKVRHYPLRRGSRAITPCGVCCTVKRPGRGSGMVRNGLRMGRRNRQSLGIGSWTTSAAMLTSVALASMLALAVTAEEIGTVDTAFKLLGPDHKVAVDAFDDEQVQGVACHVSRAVAGGLTSMVGLAEDTSDASIACRQAGPSASTASSMLAIPFSANAVRCCSSASASSASATKPATPSSISCTARSWWPARPKTPSPPCPSCLGRATKRHSPAATTGSSADERKCGASKAGSCRRTSQGCRKRRSPGHRDA